MLKPVRCEQCKFFLQDIHYKDGECLKDGRYTREHRVCNLLPTNQDRRNAKKL
jgi:hypothetical protein